MFTSKLPQVETSIFTEITQLSLKHAAVNLGQGFPDYPMNKKLCELVAQAMYNNHNQYVHSNGYLPLREAIAKKNNALYSADINPDAEIIITPGATYALYTAITMLIQPGDEVIIFEPAYDVYTPQVVVNGGIPKYVSLNYPSFDVPWKELKLAITSKTKMIIVNTPHNPTGQVWSMDDWNKLAKLVDGTDIIVLSDEVYEHIVYDNKQHISVLQHPHLAKQSLAVFSFGKTYHCTGWKLGYIIGKDNYMSEFRKLHQFNCFTCDTPKQIALTEFMQLEDEWKQVGAFVEEKRNFFREIMLQTPFTYLSSHSTYFECYSYQNISQLSDYEFVTNIMIQKMGVSAIPLSSFYTQKTDNKLIRFCFAKNENTLQLAQKAFKNYF